MTGSESPCFTRNEWLSKQSCTLLSRAWLTFPVIMMGLTHSESLVLLWRMKAGLTVLIIVELKYSLVSRNSAVICGKNMMLHEENIHSIKGCD